MGYSVRNIKTGVARPLRFNPELTGLALEAEKERKFKTYADHNSALIKAGKDAIFELAFTESSTAQLTDPRYISFNIAESGVIYGVQRGKTKLSGSFQTAVLFKEAKEDMTVGLDKENLHKDKPAMISPSKAKLPATQSKLYEQAVEILRG